MWEILQIPGVQLAACCHLSPLHYQTIQQEYLPLQLNLIFKSKAGENWLLLPSFILRMFLCFRTEDICKSNLPCELPTISEATAITSRCRALPTQSKAASQDTAISLIAVLIAALNAQPCLFFQPLWTLWPNVPHARRARRKQRDNGQWQSLVREATRASGYMHLARFRNNGQLRAMCMDTIR